MNAGNMVRLGRDTPLYEQATAALLAYIDDAGYVTGDRLPGEHTLAAELGVSRNTIREAMSELRNRGLVDRRQGAGTFVTNSPGVLRPGLETLSGLPNIAGRPDMNLHRSSWSVEEETGRDGVRRTLRLEAGEPMAVVRMAAAADGVNAATFETWIAMAHVDLPALTDYEGGSLLDYLASETLVRPVNTWSEVGAVAAGGSLAEWLGIESGAPVLRLDETFYMRSGEPVLFSVNHFRTDKVGFHIVRKVDRTWTGGGAQ